MCFIRYLLRWLPFTKSRMALANGPKTGILQAILEIKLQDLIISVAGQCFYKDNLPGQFDLTALGVPKLMLLLQKMFASLADLGSDR